jgi:hypothetical protein
MSAAWAVLSVPEVKEASPSSSLDGSAVWWGRRLAGTGEKIRKHHTSRRVQEM